MWALGFLLRFFVIQPVAQVDSKGEHQGSACVILELPNTIHSRQGVGKNGEMHGQGSSLS